MGQQITPGEVIAPSCKCGGYTVADSVDAEIALYRTIDGKPLVQGMRVLTNNLDKGTVDLSRTSIEHNWNNHTNAIWFDVMVDTTWKGEVLEELDRVMQSHDRVATRSGNRTA